MNIRRKITLPTVSPAPLTETPSRLLLAPADGEGPGLRSPVARVWGHFKRLSDRLDNSWIGDVIGAASLFGLLGAGLFMGLVFG